MSAKFRIGLTMAGAVSAGAYTGGVLDYLFQVLDAWEKEKANTDSAVPKHTISLDIISGASAGGITGAMALLALCSENRYSVTVDKRADERYLQQNIFYDSWVNLLQDDMLPVLLDPSDIQQNKKVVSLLNSAFIESVAKRAIVCLPECATAPPPYVNRQMELILTLSNLNGFKYNLKFAAEGASVHTMTQHRDYAFFQLADEYMGKGRIPLNLQKNLGIEELKQAAPATGAFPIGLAYRMFVRKKKYILQNPDLVFYKEGVSELEEFDASNLEDDYVTYNVDGGMLNNEPFDLTMKLMASSVNKDSGDNTAANKDSREEVELKKVESDFNATIIMIDPFPSDDSKSIVSMDEPSQRELTKGNKGHAKEFIKFPFDLLQVIGHIYRSLRGEALFKGEDIVEAFSKEDFSRFMIAPRRRRKVMNEEQDPILDGSEAIACGALDGFAGFFDKRFREHDFYLGRANCQAFLRKHFKVRLENGKPVNPLFAAGYTKEAIERFKFQDELEKVKFRNAADAPWYVPIIPDVYKDDPKYDEVPPDYPKYDLSKLDRHKSSVLSRIKLISSDLIPNRLLAIGFSIWFFFRKRWLYKQLRKKIEDHFKEWDLI